MFGIGAFARVAQVSVRTLHHYDDVGLLPPAQVDPQTGYRWYRADQLQRLNRILALRDLGLPLTEVRKVVDDEVSLDELRGMLRLRQAEARDDMAAEAERLSRVEARLRQIETEGRVGEYDVVVKPLEPQHVALVDTTAPVFGNATLGPIFDRLFGELLRRAGPASASRRPGRTSRCTSRARTRRADHGDGVPSRSTRTDDVIGPASRSSIFPPVARAAVTIHRGSMARVEEGYRAMLRWADETGEQIDGFSREVYLECSGDPETWVTELQFALARAQRPPSVRRRR